MLTLVGRALGRAAWPFAAVAALLATFQIALIAAAMSLAERGNFERLAEAVPGFVRDFLGRALMSFAGMATIGYFEPVPVLMVILLAAYIATEPAAEIESGLVDLVLARPLPRYWLITRTILAGALLTIGVAAAMALSMWAGLWWLAPGQEWPTAASVLRLTVYLLAIAWCFGALALVTAASVRRRATALLLVAVGAVAAYLLETLGEGWPPAAAISRLSPFHYFPGARLLEGRADMTFDLSVLGSITVAAVAAAYWRFDRRDL